MYLKAISLGDAIPVGDFEARVHSLFRRSVNLQTESSSGLLTLTAFSQPDLPQGIRLEADNDSCFDKVSMGEHVYCQEGILSFQAAPLRVELRGARRWKCDLPALHVNMADLATSQAWSCVWQALNDRQIQAEAEIVAGKLFKTRGESGMIATRKTGQALCKLVLATRTCDMAAVLAAGELVGLGTGLTPTGDDLLVGYLAGLWCTVQEDTDRRDFVARLGWAIIDLSQGTNDISRTYLFHAAQGQVSSHLLELARAIGDGGETDRLIKIAEVAMQMGHTSGMDAVTGLMLGMAAWAPPPGLGFFG